MFYFNMKITKKFKKKLKKIKKRLDKIYKMYYNINIIN